MKDAVEPPSLAAPPPDTGGMLFEWAASGEILFERQLINDQPFPPIEKDAASRRPLAVTIPDVQPPR